ncbi:MAG: PepSY-associated helix [Verrucomicrobiaceae bacterium]|nr:PepSY-associated helix [Verrucomicrobiaceae bacterium]
MKNKNTKKSWPDYRAVWRWHFYAGLFCIPFVILLSISGAIYLFKPQVEAWIDVPLDNLTPIAHRADADAQIAAALNAVAGAQFIAYELPPADNAAVRVFVKSEGATVRVYVHPQTLQILKTVREEDRFMQVVRTIHGELLIGNVGSILVELAASWAIVMVVSGIYLWWPRQVQGLAGLLFPRIGRGQRTFWRDIHAVTGIWISAFALVLLLSGLPWANVWGSYFKALRTLTGTAVAAQDWTVGRENADKQSSGKTLEQGASQEHVGHDHSAMQKSTNNFSTNYAQINRVVAVVSALQLAPPVRISPSTSTADLWAAKSDAQNRLLRADLLVNGASGEIVRRENFNQRHLIDRIIGTGVAAHEGQLFGWFNQLLGLFTALGLVLLSVSAVVLWWRRRATGLLGAPIPLQQPRFSFGLVVVVAGLAIYLPLFGASVAVVFVLEKFLFSQIPAVNRWLGLPEKIYKKTCEKNAAPFPE